MATTIENLSWTATKDKDWIRVNPTAGTGSQDVTIEVTASTVVGDTDTAGTVTFICGECNPPMREVVNVYRCFPTECEYESTGVTTYTFQNKEVGKCDTSIEFDVPYETVYKSTNGCNDKKVTGSEHVSLTFTKNDTSSPRTVGEVEGKYKVTQEKGPCTSCGCSDITVSPSTMSWDWDKTTESSATISIGSECSSLISVTGVSATGDFKATLDGSTIKVKPNGQNPGTSGGKTGSVTVSFTYNGTSNSCDNKITLSQSSQGCDCTKLTLSKSSVSVNVGGTDTVTVTPNCVETSTISVVSSDTSKATASYENRTITITGVAKGTATVTVKYTAGTDPNCTKEISVNVGCPTITITHTPETLTCEGGDMQFTATES